jgi:flavin-dependent dehydrogenase
MRKMMSQYDVIVVGAGVAGSAVAIYLAQSGKQVLLLEKTASAHHKVCGEFISIEACGYLDQLGIRLDLLGAQGIETIRLIRNRQIISAPLPFQAQSLSRYALDEALIARAQDVGVEVRRGIRVSNIFPEEDRWRVECPESALTASHLFLATGKHDLRGWRRPARQNELIGFKMHFGIPDKALEKLTRATSIFLFAGGYAGLQRIEDKRVNLCLVVSKSFFVSSSKKWDGLLAHLFESNPILSEYLSESTPCWPNPLSISGIPYGYVYRPDSSTPNNLYRIGDQIAVIPSFCGDGIAIALRTAFIAAKHLISDNAIRYHKQAHSELAPQIAAAMRFSNIIEHPAGQSAMIAACGVLPGILTTIAKQTRLRKFD